jgi:hypothetical protein
MLLDIVFTKQGEEVKEGDMWRHGTRDFTPFKDAHGDENPIIRSFLLQLLLEHNTKKVKVHLNAYFTRCQQALVGGVGVDQELSLLCVQCFENAVEKEYCGLSFKGKIGAMTDLLKSSADTLTCLPGFATISLDSLESVARMRYALQVVAELLLLQVNEQGGSLESHTQNLHGRIASVLLEEARCVCTAERINNIDPTGRSNTTGPLIYLLKLIVRQGGTSCLKKIIENQQLKWLVPLELENDEEKNDPFVLYKCEYPAIREEMCTAVYGRNYKELEEHTAV